MIKGPWNNEIGIRKALAFLRDEYVFWMYIFLMDNLIYIIIYYFILYVK